MSRFRSCAEGPHAPACIPLHCFNHNPLYFYMRRSEHFQTQKGLVCGSFLKTRNAHQGHFNYVVAPSLVELPRVSSPCNGSPVAEYKCFCAERNAQCTAFFRAPRSHADFTKQSRLPAQAFMIFFRGPIVYISPTRIPARWPAKEVLGEKNKIS